MAIEQQAQSSYDPRAAAKGAQIPQDQRPYQQRGGGSLIPQMSEYPGAAGGQPINYDERNPAAYQNPEVVAYQRFREARTKALQPPQYGRAFTPQGGLPAGLQVQADPRGFDAIKGLATNYDQGPLAQALANQAGVQARVRRDQASGAPQVSTLAQALKAGGTPQAALQGLEQGMGREQAMRGGLAEALQRYGAAGGQMAQQDLSNVERMATLRDIEQQQQRQAYSDLQKARAGEALEAAARPTEKKWYEFWK